MSAPRMVAALIRHGDYEQLPNTPSAHQPFPLNKSGAAQVAAAIPELLTLTRQLGLHLSHQVDSSQLLRAWQTANLFAQGLQDQFATTPIITSYDALAERCVGSAANLTTAEIEAVLKQDPRFSEPPKDWKSNSYYQLPLQGAESLMMAGERVAGHIIEQVQNLQETIQQDTLKLFVGHGAAFRHAAHQLGVLAFDDIAKLSMYHARPVLLELRADGSWCHIGGEWKVRKKHSAYLD